jgi:hypothetical protein
MNVLPMRSEVLSIANAMIRESSLPHLPASELQSKRVRIPTSDQLHGPFQSHIGCRREQQVHMLSHQNKSMQGKFPLSSVAVHCLQEKLDIRLDDKQSSAPPSQERYEVRSRRVHHARRFQEPTSAAESRVSNQPNAARVELVPFPVENCRRMFSFGNAGFLATEVAFSHRNEFFSSLSSAGVHLI